MTQGAQTRALWQPSGVGQDIRIPMLIHADVRQKPTQCCKAVILQWKINKSKNGRMVHCGWVESQLWMEMWEPGLYESVAWKSTAAKWHHQHMTEATPQVRATRQLCTENERLPLVLSGGKKSKPLRRAAEASWNEFASPLTRTLEQQWNPLLIQLG